MKLMKCLFLLIAALVFLPKAHACTVTLTPGTATLQTKQTESVTATLQSCTGSSTTWTLSCTPSGTCGYFTNTTNTSAIYHAPINTPSQQLAVTLKATYGSAKGTANATIIIPTSLTISPANASIYLGAASQAMTATENFSDNVTTQNVTSSASFSSSSTTVASVSGNLVTSVNFGASTISASYTDPLAGTNLNASTSLTVSTAVQINAAIIPNIPSGLLNDDTYHCAQFYPQTSTNWAPFINNLLGGGNGSQGKYIWGVSASLIWNQIEVDQGSTVVAYDFDCVDQYLNNFVAAGKKINLIVQGITDGTTGNQTNPSTPAYVLSDGVDVSNASECSYVNEPMVYEVNPGHDYQTPYKAFIKAVLQHYSNSCSTASPGTPPCSGNNGANGPSLAPSIGYIRFGLSTGGEAFPKCIGWAKTLPAPNKYVSEVYPFNTQNPQPKTWLSYVSSMDAYEKSLGSSIPLIAALNQADTPSIELAYPDGEAYYGVQNGQSIGSQGLQESDTTGTTTCTSDWCVLFDTYHSQTQYAELQTLYYSDPTNAQPTGSLNDIVPFAIQHHNANVFELYATDLFLAFDPNDYTSNLGGYNSAYPPYSSSYASTLEAAVSGNQ